MTAPEITRLLQAAGYQAEPPEWRVTSDPAVPPAQFGKDHYSTLLYIETRAIDHKGQINHDNMRDDPDRHPIMHLAKRRVLTGMLTGRKYPTRLIAGIEKPDHDDYDCLDDMLAAGWLTVTMPTPAEDARDVFLDASSGRIVQSGDGDPVEPSFLTGLGELWLCTRAKWGMTDKGREVTTLLRKHKEEGGNYASFRLPAELL